MDKMMVGKPRGVKFDHQRSHKKLAFRGLECQDGWIPRKALTCSEEKGVDGGRILRGGY